MDPNPLSADFRLRGDLVLHHSDRDPERFVLEDTSTGNFYRLGRAEASFVATLLEGRSLPQAHQVSQRVDATSAMDQNDCERFCQWLARCGLVQGTMPPEPNARPLLKGLMTPFYFRIPLVDPDSWLEKLDRSIGWLHHRKLVTSVLFAFLAMLLYSLPSYGEFIDSVQNVITSGRWLWIAIAYVLLKIVHEFGHATACRHFGGEVREAGLAAILLMPLAYVNVSSCWRFSSRWQRLHVTLAGVTAELVVATLAMGIWHGCESTVVRDCAANLVVLVFASSILFNLNPLLKFDGYYALADLTGVDNLYQISKQYSQHFVWRYVFGIERKSISRMCSQQPLWIKVYAISASVYRVLVSAGLIACSAQLFGGAGFVVAVVGCISFFLLPCLGVVGELWRLWRDGKLLAGRLSIRCSVLAGLMMGVLCLLPSRATLSVPGVVEYDPPSILRVATPGLVSHVYVANGQQVLAGEKILSLENTELTTRHAELQKELALAELTAQASRWTNDPSKLGEAETSLRSLKEQFEVTSNRVNALVVRAPVSGRVVARDLQQLSGRYLNEGDLLGEIGIEQRKRIKISVGQRDIDRANDWLNKPQTVYLVGHQRFSALATRVETTATNHLNERSLLAPYGGSLTAQMDRDGEFTSVVARTNAYLSLDPEQARSIRCGQRAYVRLDSKSDSLAQAIYQRARNAMLDLFANARTAQR